jgi:tRNA(fMet)-specific endonuclease VapC
MFVLDTDHLIVIQRRSEPEWGVLRNRMERYDRGDFYLSVISVHEQMLGANNYISRSKDRAGVIRGYRMIESAMIDYARFPVLAFDEPSAIQFDELRKQRVRIGTMDLRIASIALSHDCTVLTRNTVDFGTVPGLRVVDWTIA